MGARRGVGVVQRIQGWRAWNLNIHIGRVAEALLPTASVTVAQ